MIPVCSKVNGVHDMLQILNLGLVGGAVFDVCCGWAGGWAGDVSDTFGSESMTVSSGKSNRQIMR